MLQTRHELHGVHAWRDEYHSRGASQSSTANVHIGRRIWAEVRQAWQLEEFTYQLEGPIGLDLKPVKRALKVPPRPSTSGYLDDENGP